MIDYDLAKESAEITMRWHDSLPRAKRMDNYSGMCDSEADPTWNRQHRRPRNSGTLKPIQLRRMGLMRQFG